MSHPQCHDGNDYVSFHVQDSYATTKQVQNVAPKKSYVFEVPELRTSPFITYSHSYLGNGNDAYRMEAVQAMPTSKGIHPCFGNGNGSIPVNYAYNGISGKFPVSELYIAL